MTQTEILLMQDYYDSGSLKGVPKGLFMMALEQDGVNISKLLLEAKEWEKNGKPDISLN